MAPLALFRALSALGLVGSHPVAVLGKHNLGLFWPPLADTLFRCPGRLIGIDIHGCEASAVDTDHWVLRVPVAAASGASLSSPSAAAASSSSSAAGMAVVSTCACRHAALVSHAPVIFTSAVSGLGCRASSSSLADRRSFRAASAWLKTVADAVLRRLFSLRVVERALLAMLAGVCLVEAAGDGQTRRRTGRRKSDETMAAAARVGAGR